MNAHKRRNETATNEPAPRVHRRTRRLAVLAGTGASLGAMALLLMLPAMAAATSVASFSAPFTGGTAVQLRDPTSQGCGQTLTVSKVASFALSTGTATGSAAAKASPCSTADSQATYDGTMGVKGLSFKAASAASVSVKATWSVSWKASASMTAAAANAGAQSTVEIYLILQVTDATAKKTTSAPFVFVIQKDLTSAASYASSGTSKSYSITLSGYGLVSGHSYTVYAALAFSAQAVVPQGSPSGSVTTASVNLGSTGYGGVLSGVTVG